MESGFRIRRFRRARNVSRRDGGLPIFADEMFLGAIGVSGGKSSEDAQVANAGVNALKK